MLFVARRNIVEKYNLSMQDFDQQRKLRQKVCYIRISNCPLQNGDPVALQLLRSIFYAIFLGYFNDPLIKFLWPSHRNSNRKNKSLTIRCSTRSFPVRTCVSRDLVVSASFCWISGQCIFGYLVLLVLGFYSMCGIMLSFCRCYWSF